MDSASVTVLTAQAWRTNGHMIADVAKLGYLGGQVVDLTWGFGTFWSQWVPPNLVGCDLNPVKSPLGRSVDFRKTGFPENSFDSVVFDPPYKLNGTPTDDVDARYGVDVPTRWQDRHALIRDGITECAWTCRHGGYVLLKCMDQVVSGKKRWQTIEFTNYAAEHYLNLVDRFDMLVTPRPQPEGRRQVHSQQNYSTLLVFQKG